MLHRHGEGNPSADRRLRRLYVTLLPLTTAAIQWFNFQFYDDLPTVILSARKVSKVEFQSIEMSARYQPLSSSVMLTGLTVEFHKATLQFTSSPNFQKTDV